MYSGTMTAYNPTAPGIDPEDFQSAVNQALSTILFVSYDETGEPLDAEYTIADVSDELRHKVTVELGDFMKTNGKNSADLAGLDINQIAHDWVLSRNGEGTGFWDRDLGERGDRLDLEASKQLEIRGYIGDDGQIHF